MADPRTIGVARRAGDNVASVGDVCDLSVVVPAFDEARRLPSLLRALRANLRSNDELIVVDDGSSDDTSRVAETAREWCQRLSVLRHGSNQGKGAAVRTGVRRASGSLIAFVDADNATDLAVFDTMRTRIEGDVGAVFGSRHHPDARVVGSPPIRGLMGRVFNHVVRLAAGTPISDTQCGAKMFWAPAARVAFSGATIDGFAFDVELVRRFDSLGVGVVEHPVNWTYVPGTKIRTLTPLHMLADIARLRLVSERPLPSVEVDPVEGLTELVEPLLPGRPLADANAARIRVLIPDDAEDLDALVTRFDGLGARPDQIRR